MQLPSTSPESLTRPTLADVLLSRFEQSWRSGGVPTLDDYLAEAGNAGPHILPELVGLDLEYRIRTGTTVSVEDYLRRYPELNAGRDTLLRLVVREYVCRRKQDPSTSVETYRQRFPQLADELPPAIASWFADAGLPQVPGYDVTEVIGRGGMGVVYKAWHVRLKRPAALKMLRDTRPEPEELARFRTEAETVARLRHPNIVQIYDYGEYQGRPYVVLEYVEGGSLAERFDGKPQPPAESARLVETLAAAMHTAHSAGIVHRDLKPANVLLSVVSSPLSVADSAEQRTTDNGQRTVPKIADFGLAKRVEEAGQTRTGQVMGTPAYMAPEQAAGRIHEVGPPADVYALGVLLYEALTGRPPFQAPTPAETLRQVIERDPLPPSRLQPGVPRDLETITLKCLEKDASKRYPTAQALADDLQRYRDGRPILARPPSVWYRLHRFTRRHRTPVAAAAVVLLTLLGALAVVSTQVYQRWQAEEDRRQQSRQQRLRDLETNAVMAGRSGNWGKAIELLDEAIDGGHPDQVGLTVKKARMLLTLNRREAVQQTLHALEGMDLGAHEAAVLLLRGDFAQSNWKGGEEGRQWIARALDTGALSPADQAYAEGLLAPTCLQAEVMFEKALRLDNFHHGARSMLQLILLCLGKREQARQQAWASRQLFPEDVSTVFTEAFVDFLEGNRNDAEAHLDALRGQVSDQQLADLKALFGNLHDVLQTTARFDELTVMDHFRLGQALFKLAGILAQRGEQTQIDTLALVRSQNLPAIANSWGQMMTVLTDSFKGRSKLASDRMTKIVAGCPEGFLLSLCGHLRMHSFDTNQAPALVRQEGKAIADLFDRSWGAPHLLPGVERKTRIWSVASDSTVLGAYPTLAPRTRDKINWFLTQPKLTKEELSWMNQAARWCADPELSRRCLKASVALEPENLDLLQRLAQVELDLANYPAALRAAQKVLSVKAKSAEMQKVKAAAIAGMERLVPMRAPDKPF